MRRALLALLALTAAPVFSQAIGTATLTWTAPTENVNGTPLTDLAGYNVYRSFSLAAAPTLYKSITDPAALIYVDAGLTPGGYCYALTAFAKPLPGETVPRAESGQSPLSCKTIATPVVPPTNSPPKPPSNVSITIAVVTGANVSPVYKILAGGKRSDVLAGFVGVGKACTGAVVFTYRGVKFRKVLATDVQWWQSAATDQVAAGCS